MRLRQHVNPLGIHFSEFHGELPELDDSRDIELEIGCADAQFLFARARLDPSRTYLGVEIRDPMVAAVNRRARAENLPVHAVFCNANNHLRQLLPPRCVARVFVNFPDPWFKKRHHKRRMLDEALARDIHRILKPAGELLFQSDVWDVALEAMDILERLDGLYQNRVGEWSFWKGPNPYGVRSWREEQCESKGLAIWRLLYHAM